MSSRQSRKAKRASSRKRPGKARANFSATKILTWDEVNHTHRIRNGIYQKNGRLVSLLTDFGRINPCYPDSMNGAGDTILYTGDGRRGDQYLNPANLALL